MNNIGMRHAPHTRPFGRHLQNPFMLAGWLTALLFFVSIFQPLYAAAPAGQWWDTNHTYRQALTVTTGASAPLNRYNGYTAMRSLNTSTLIGAGKLLASCDDLRVVWWNGSAWVELDRHIVNCNTAATQVWFKLRADIGDSASDDNYYLYYGNPAAGAGPVNKNNVYVYYDDFESYTLGSPSSGWVMIVGNATVENHAGSKALRMHAASNNTRINLRKDISPAERDILVEADCKIDTTVASNGYCGPGARWSGTTSANESGYMGEIRYSTDQSLAQKYVTGTWGGVGTAVNETVTRGTYYRVRLTAVGTAIKMYRDGTLKVNATDSSLSSADMLGIDAFNAATAQYEFLDNYLARRFVEAEPSVAAASEEQLKIISGTVYTDEGVTLIGNGAVIRLLVNGTSQGTSATAGGTGTYSITTTALSPGDAILVYIDGFATKGSTASVSNGASLNALNIYGGHVIARHDNAGSISNANIKAAKGAYVDTDIEYSVDGSNNLTVSGSAILYLPASHSYTPSANVVTPAMKSLGTFNGGAGTIDSNGDLLIAGGVFTATSGITYVNRHYTRSAGTFTHNSGTVIFDGTSGINLITPGGQAFYNIGFNDAAGTATYQLQGALTVANDLTATDGILDTKSGSNFAVNVTRDFLQTGGRVLAQSSTVTVGRHFTASGAELETGFNTASLVMTGTGDLTYGAITQEWNNGFNNLTVGQSGNTVTLVNTLAVINNLTLGSGTFTGASQSVYLKKVGTPLVFDPNSTISIARLKFFGAGAQNIPVLSNGYGSTIQLVGANTSVTQLGATTLNAGKSLLIDGDSYVTRINTYSTGGFALTVSGNIQVGAGSDSGTKTFNATNSTVTVGGNIDIRSGTTAFTNTSSTVILNGAATQTVLMSGKSFNNLTITNASVGGVQLLDGFSAANFTDVTAASKIIFKAGATYAISGTLTLTGSSGNEIMLLSDSAGTRFTLNITGGAQAVSYVSVKDSQSSTNSITASSSINVSGNDDLESAPHWIFEKIISGTIYTDEGVTLIGNGAVIRLLVNGTSQGTSATAGGTGTYSITTTALSPGDAILVYIDGFATKGSTTSVSNGASLSGLHIYGGHVIARHDNGGSISNANIQAAKGAYVDTDIEYSADGSNNLTVSGSAILYVPASHSYTPAANIVTPAMKSLGTFNGGAGVMTVNGALTQGGGAFTATSGTTTITGDFTISAGTFTHNSGIVALTGTSARTVNTGSASLNNLTINTNTNAVTITGTVSVSGNLTLTAYYQINTGTLAVSGNVTTTVSSASAPSSATILVNGTGAQTLGASGGTGSIPGVIINKPSGTLTLQDTIRVFSGGGWTWTAGTVDAGTSTVQFYASPGGGAPMTVNAGSMSFNNVAVDMTVWDLTITGTLIANGNLALNSYSTISTGTIAVAGNVTTTSATGTLPSSATLLLNGAGAQTVGASGGSGKLPKVTINKSSGILTLQDTLVVYAGWTWTAGTVDAGTSTVQFYASAGNGVAMTVNAGAMSFNNVTVDMSVWDLTITGTMIVTGNFTITSVDSVSGGTIAVGGNLITADTTVNGSTNITFNGTGVQTIAATVANADLPNGTLTISKTAGTATLASNLILNGAGTNVTVNQGTLDIAGFNFTVPATLTANAAGIVRLQGGETVAATTRTFNAGSTVIYNGGGSYASLALGNSYSNLTFNNGAGSWTHTGALITKDLTLTTGTLLSGGQNISVSGHWSNSGTYTSGSNTVTFNGVGQNITGNTTFNNFTKSVASADTLTFAASSITSINGVATINGASGQLLTLASSAPGTHWNLTLGASATKSINYVSVSWGDASGSDPSQKNINPTSSTDGGNNIAWFSFIISGTVYSDEGVTLIGDGAVIRLLVNGASQGTSTTTGGTGTYSIAATTLNAGDALLVYIDGFATKGSAVTVSNGGNLSGLNIYGGEVITRHDNAGSLSNANMKTAKGAYVDTDIEYSVDASNNLTVSGSAILYVLASHSYTPAANIVTPEMKSLGTFNGGTGSVTISKLLTISGGTFASTTGIMSLGAAGPSSTLFLRSGGVFNHNNGTVRFVASNGCASTTWTLSLTGTVTFNHLDAATTVGCGTAALQVAGGDTLVVAGNLTHTSGTLQGAWQVQGNLLIGASAQGGLGTITMNGNTTQTYTHSGGVTANLAVNTTGSVAPAPGTTTLAVSAFTLTTGAFTAPSGIATIGTTQASSTVFSQAGGTFNHNNGTVKFASGIVGCGAGTYIIDVAGSLTLNHVDATTTAGCGVSALQVAGGDTLILAGNLTHTSGALQGAWQVQGNLLIGASAQGGLGTITMNGNAAQIYTHLGGITANLAVNTTGSVAPAPGTTTLAVSAFTLTTGTFTAPSGIATIGTTQASSTVFSQAGGTFNHNSGTVKFASNNGCLGSTWTLSLTGTITFNHVDAATTVACGTATLQATGGTVVAAGNLTHTSGALQGSWQVQGNFLVTTTAAGGTATIAFTGASNQTYTNNGGNEPDGSYTVNKGAGTVTLVSSLNLNAASQSLTITSGTLDLVGNGVTVNNILTVGASGILQLQGGEAVTATTRTLNAGSTVIYNGGGVYGSLAAGNTYSNLTFNNAAGSWTHTAPLTTGQNLTITTGTLISAGQNINVAGNWNNSGTYTSGANTVTLNGAAQNISGNSTFNNLTKSVISADTLTFASGSVQSITGTMTLSGRSANILNLRASTPGSQWNLNVSGTSAVSHVDVDDSNASGGNTIYAYYSTDDTGPSNNINWVFQSLQLVKQVWSADGTTCFASVPSDSNCNGGVTSIVVPTNTTVTFLIFIRNVMSVAVGDVRFQDLIDDVAFTYQAGTLMRSANDGSAPADNATLNTIMTAVTFTQSDSFDGDTQLDEFAGINAVVSPDDLQVGGSGGVGQNDTLALPANKSFALKFKAVSH